MFIVEYLLGFFARAAGIDPLAHRHTTSPGPNLPRLRQAHGALCGQRPVAGVGSWRQRGVGPWGRGTWKVHEAASGAELPTKILGLWMLTESFMGISYGIIRT